MDILVVGGAGFIGRHLCATLSDRGHAVTALSRSPNPAVLPDDVDTATGDVTDYEAIADAAAGKDALVNLVSPSPLFKPRGGSELYDEIIQGGTETCIQAATDEGVERFCYVSGLDVHPDADTAYLRAKGRAEEIVRESDLDWTIVRPSVVFGDGDEFVGFTRLVTLPVLSPMPGGGKTRFQPIYVENLADVLAETLVGEEHVGQTYEIGGPEVLTLAEVGTLARAAKGQSVRPIPVPMGLVKVGMWTMDHIPFAPFGMDQYRSLKLDNTLADNDITVFDVDPDELTTLANYLEVEPIEK